MTTEKYPKGKRGVPALEAVRKSLGFVPTFGDVVRAMRENEEISLASMARRTGLEVWMLEMIETSSYLPPRKVLAKIAAVLQVSPEYLAVGVPRVAPLIRGQKPATRSKKTTSRRAHA